MCENGDSPHFSPIVKRGLSPFYGLRKTGAVPVLCLFRRFVPFLLALAIAGCASKAARPATPQLPLADAAEVDRLRHELDALFHTPRINALWAIAVQSLDTGEVLYEQNADLLMIPASNMKIVTMAVAAEQLGWEHRFETRLEAHGTITNGTLYGSLVAVGGGDPSFGGPLDDAAPVFQEWTTALRSAGIARVDGCLVGDGSAFEGEALGDGWSWDDLAFGYSAPISALSFHENIVELTVRPGPAPGEPARVALTPAAAGLALSAQVGTGPPESEADIDLRRDLGGSFLTVSGTIPVNAEPYERVLAVPQPPWFFVSELGRTLAESGIMSTRGPVARESLELISERDAGAVPCLLPSRESPARVIATHRSKPLTEIGTRFMKVSQNLYGEMLLRAIGARATIEDGEESDVDTVERARQRVDDQLRAWGVPPGQVRLADGSGLSRYNLVTARVLLQILREMWRNPAHRDRFYATLPIAGQDGTLDERFHGTRAAGNAHAKTGTLSGVRALSGYVRTVQGEMLAFSMLANNFIVPTPSIDSVVDLAVERLAHFSRAN
jgi:D-alanyl-D-alanine carboxypeptidase/D-alanyl-D-alanine-endopeptidase (penicillin-binding protein 4)